ncbi:septation protein IspZ [Leptolyngbya sp. 15MV]|nr:septation protein IspZ [Leptolyngbya sp. 15MV]
MFFGLVLIAGWLKGRAFLQTLLEAAFEGLDREGWLKLSRNWGVFFLALAGLNEILRQTMSFEGWLWAKLWVFMPLSFLFTFTQIPMLLRHGLALEDKDEPLKQQPPTGE